MSESVAEAVLQPGEAAAQASRQAQQRRHRRRRVAWLLAAVCVLALAVGIAGNRLYMHPRVDHLAAGQRVDAVVALGGLTQTAKYAQTLVEQGAAPVLVLSNPYDPGGGKSVKATCASHPADYQIICFVPDPATTRGEAQEIQTLARANGWTRVAVVAPTFHISRARLLVQRCYPNTLLMLALPAPVAWDEWTYEYLRQTAGYAKAALRRSC